MPRLVDTTIRVLSQEPLAGTVPTAGLLRLAETLDRAGFASLEVSGGGVFEHAVRAGVESPWERIRALRARTKTPLALAVRGRFLVGSHPVGDDLVRRFVRSAGESGIDVFRLHDPLNDMDNLKVAAEAIQEAGKEFDGGILYGSGRHESIVNAAKRLPELGATRVLLHDPSGLLQPHRAGELVRELGELSGLPVGLFNQGAGRNGLALALEAARAGADLIACAIYPVALAGHRISAESAAQALDGIGFGTGVDVDVLWEASDLVDADIHDVSVAPLVPRISVRAARRKVPVGVVAAIAEQLENRGASDRLDEVLDELERVRLEAGSPPLGAPMGQVIASQALVNVLGASRYPTIVDELRDLVSGRFGATPGPIDAALVRGVELMGGGSAEEVVDLDSLRTEAQGLATSEEELLLLALFGDEAETLLRSIRGRSGGEEQQQSAAGAPDREAQIRAVVQIVQQSGVGEITIEQDGMKVTVRQASNLAPVSSSAAAASAAMSELDLPVEPPSPPGSFIAVESPMVGTFYRSREPGTRPFVEVGDPVAPGQTLCILEAMKLMNEVKSEVEGIIRKVHVSDGAAVEYGQLLFELEPLNGLPVGA